MENNYPDLTIDSKVIENESSLSLTLHLTLFLNGNPIDILLGYEYLLQRFTYIYNLIRNHITEKYEGIFDNLWTENINNTIGLYFPPLQKSNFVDSNFIIVVTTVKINNDNNCSKFFKFMENNFYYLNNFKYISINPKIIERQYTADLLIVPKPFERNDPNLGIYNIKPIKNIDQFEKYYDQNDKESFYKLIINKMYENLSRLDYPITLWFAGAQTGCLHAKITNGIAYYSRVFALFNKNTPDIIKNIANLLNDDYISKNLAYYMYDIYYNSTYDDSQETINYYVNEIYDSELYEEIKYVYSDELGYGLEDELEGKLKNDFILKFVNLILNKINLLDGGNKINLLDGVNTKSIYKQNNKMIFNKYINIKNNYLQMKNNKKIYKYEFNDLELELISQFKNYNKSDIIYINSLAESDMLRKNILENIVNIKDIPNIRKICEKYYKPIIEYNKIDLLFIELSKYNLENNNINLLISSIILNNIGPMCKYLKVNNSIVKILRNFK